jgi:hypothetical protein
MDNASRHIVAKFDLAARLVRAAGAPAGPLEDLRARYALVTAPLYLRAAGGGAGRTQARREFQRLVAAEGFVARLDDIVAGAAARLPTKKARRGAAPLLSQYGDHRVDCAHRATALARQQFDRCDECRVEMVVDPDASELECPRCRRCRPLYGVVFDDAQFYNQEGQKAKTGSSNPNRHYQFWIDHILAREPEEELQPDPGAGSPDPGGAALLARMRQIVRRDNKILRLLTVEDVREMLKELGRTELNKNVALIMKKLTGVGPPAIPEAIHQRAEKLFTMATRVGARLRPVSHPNRSYYPYYIYKIYDQILAPDDAARRRILYYIYLQGDDTLDKNDYDWWDICAEVPELTWTATSQIQALAYHPR